MIDRNTELIPAQDNHSIEPLPEIGRERFSVTARVLTGIYTTPLGIVCLTGGIATLLNLGEIKTAIEQEAQLLQSTPSIYESMIAMGVATTLAGGIVLANTAVELTRLARWSYRQLRTQG